MYEDLKNLETNSIWSFANQRMSDFKKNQTLPKNINILDLVVISKFKSSKSEIRRLIKGKAIRVNNKTIEDEKFLINDKSFHENYLKLSIGKKRHIKIELI